MSDAKPRIGRVGAFRALFAGSAAARDGGDVTDCPYDLNGDYEQRVKARYWIRGFTKAQLLLRQQQRTR